MKRAALSGMLSWSFTSLAGWLLFGVHFPREATSTLRIVFLSAFYVSVLIHLLFFYIRRWDGCIEKLGGATFTLIMLFAAMFPLALLQDRFSEQVRPDILWLLIIFGVQMIVAGFIATCFLRSSAFTPPKPGEPLL